MNTNPFDLSGKTALVTGASRGLGLGFAKTLAQAGANVIMTSRSLESLDGPATEVESLGGGKAATIELDVREQGSIRSAIAQAIKQGSESSRVVDSAPIGCSRPFVKCHGLTSMALRFERFGSGDTCLRGLLGRKFFGLLGLTDFHLWDRDACQLLRDTKENAAVEHCKSKAEQ